MKKTRIILAVVAAIVAICLCALVCVQWHKQGCGGWSLFAGCAVFTTMTAAIWNTIDAVIKERNE